MDRPRLTGFVTTSYRKKGDALLSALCVLCGLQDLAANRDAGNWATLKNGDPDQPTHLFFLWTTQTRIALARVDDEIELEGATIRGWWKPKETPEAIGAGVAAARVGRDGIVVLFADASGYLTRPERRFLPESIATVLAPRNHRLAVDDVLGRVVLIDLTLNVDLHLHTELYVTFPCIQSLPSPTGWRPPTRPPLDIQEKVDDIIIRFLDAFVVASQGYRKRADGMKGAPVARTQGMTWNWRATVPPEDEPMEEGCDLVVDVQAGLADHFDVFCLVGEEGLYQGSRLVFPGATAGNFYKAQHRGKASQSKTIPAYPSRAGIHLFGFAVSTRLKDVYLHPTSKDELVDRDEAEATAQSSYEAYNANYKHSSGNFIQAKMAMSSKQELAPGRVYEVMTWSIEFEGLCLMVEIPAFVTPGTAHMPGRPAAPPTAHRDDLYYREQTHAGMPT